MTVADAPTAATDRILIRGVNKRYQTGRDTFVALDSIDLEIERGSFTTLFGPSGCGKTTLLRILAGLQRPDSGQVSLFGQTPAAAARTKNIAWVPQSSALLPWRSVRDNVLLSRSINRRADQAMSHSVSDADVDRVLAEMDLTQFARSRPAQLSGGMRQRVSLARGFVQGAPLMLMDEPFSALDELTREVLRAKLIELWQSMRKAVVFVTHSAAEAVLLSDRVVVMTARPGRIHKIIDVDLPRPRDAAVERSARFQDVVAEVRSALSEGA